MYNTYDVERWREAVYNLQKRSIPCPSCETVHEVVSHQVDGKAIMLDRSSDSNLVYVNVRYPAFIPPHHPQPGYVVMLCKVCNTRIVVEVPLEDYQQARVVWPLPGVVVSEDVPEPVRSAVVDAKRAYAVDSKTGAIMSVRTAVERIQRQQEVGSLTELWDKRKLPLDLFDTANEPRLWGHVVAHNDFAPEAVTRGHVAELLTFVDRVLELIYKMPARLQRAKKAREEVERGKGTKKALDGAE